MIHRSMLTPRLVMVMPPDVEQPTEMMEDVSNEGTG